MPEKYHIATTVVPPRNPRIGKFGIIDWREDCARCHNCVKKACVYDRYRQEQEYIKNIDNVDSLFFECMGCLSCVQNCTRGLLTITQNSQYLSLGNEYWKPAILLQIWDEAETAKVPVSGAGYRGKFSGHGFDSMWTDMSEIVRPTRDGIHGREYISTSVDIGAKVKFLTFDKDKKPLGIPRNVSIPMPMVIDLSPKEYELPKLQSAFIETAKRCGIIALVDSKNWPIADNDPIKNNASDYLPHIAFYLNPNADAPPDEDLKKAAYVEIPVGPGIKERAKKLKQLSVDLIVSARVPLDKNGVDRAIDLASSGLDVLHVVADLNGDEIGVEHPRFIKDMVLELHRKLIENGNRDEVTIIGGGGVALAEHLTKGMLCGADLLSVSLPLLITQECRLCKVCKTGMTCPAGIETADFEYSVGRMVNMISSWHWQLVEMMGAMGMREARRLRGDTGRAIFYEAQEDDIFGKIFGPRKIKAND